MSKQGKNQAESSFKAAFPQEKTEALAIYLDKKAVFRAAFGGISGKAL